MGNSSENMGTPSINGVLGRWEHRLEVIGVEFSAKCLMTPYGGYPVLMFDWG
jgi:hypothetical protein